jgi:antitoxin (DNA-binding transcriptional repressor) of toxin-antitoxin stability system
MLKASARTVSKALGKYLDLAHGGHEIVVTKRGIPWAKLRPEPLSKKRKKAKKQG